MKHVFAVILLLFMYAATKAQPDPLNYYVVLKDSSAFACKIPYRKQGQIIKAVKLDNTEIFIGWTRIDTIFLIRNDGTKLDERSVSSGVLRSIKDEEVRLLARKKWVPCFILLQSGDTILGKADPAKDYCTTGSYNQWAKENWWVNEFEIVNRLEVDEKYRYATIKEICIKDSSGLVRYISVNGTMYKLIVDGTVKLLYRRKIYTRYNDGTSTPYQSGMGFGMQTHMPPIAPELTEDRNYYLYKSAELYDTNTFTGLAKVTDDFIEDCETIFEGCPAVIARINAQKGRNVNLKSITEEYNVCIKQ